MQESGVPNVTGYLNEFDDFISIGGSFYRPGGGQTSLYNSESTYNTNIHFSSNRSSNQYQNISEVRVKSIISNGYIRIF